MAGYLDAYGVADARKERLRKRVILAVLAVVVIGGAAYFTFRNWRQERTMKEFLTLLGQKEYQSAYALWGCTQDHPCKYYGPEQFAADWGPGSPYADVSSIKIAHEDNCGEGVVFDIQHPNTKDIGLYVDSGTNLIGYGPPGDGRCPGKHFQL